ncbi:uncharacterized protein PgNI_02713 [Pyricularia grisea]|uniref:Uncharacterized protein n=1 Tax=Pyricularia grisea TaxID=148305 RepID=A0A6P8BC78_PYRGI|nr:uncharacterized protein PgNI_02713 [Pyricularia grisea]TLD13435.1 hypothetical protein PgNI_02713 [Pyricularia grisea]
MRIKALVIINHGIFFLTQTRYLAQTRYTIPIFKRKDRQNPNHGIPDAKRQDTGARNDTEYLDKILKRENSYGNTSLPNAKRPRIDFHGQVGSDAGVERACSNNIPGSLADISETVKRRTFKNAQLRQQLKFQQEKSEAGVFLLREATKTIKTLQSALVEFESRNDRI